MPSLGSETDTVNTWATFAVDLLEPELAPMLSPARYMRLLGIGAGVPAQRVDSAGDR